MDPVTLSISLALVSGVASGLTEAGKNAVTDAYIAIKNRLLEKFKKNSNIPETINALEVNPNSKTIKDNLATEIKKVEADKDVEILELAFTLIELMKKTNVGDTSQIVHGNYNAVSTGGGIATITVNKTENQNRKKSKQ